MVLNLPHEGGEPVIHNGLSARCADHPHHWSGELNSGTSLQWRKCHIVFALRFFFVANLFCGFKKR